MTQALLHGTIHATVYEMGSLPNELLAGLRGSNSKYIRKLIKEIVAFRNPPPTDVYVTIDLGKARVGRTMKCTSYNGSLDLYWHESFHIYCAHLASDVIFTVMLDGPIGQSIVGRAYLPVPEILAGEEVHRGLQVFDNQGVRVVSTIDVKLQYFDVSRDRNWSRGVWSTNYVGVPYTIFSQRQGCKVTLYQGCHVRDGFVPKIPLAGGKTYEAHKYWEDIFDAISKARHLIYITGWSVNTKITMFVDSRRQTPGGHVVLGDLLKMKATEGVRVLMLVLEDSDSVGLLTKGGSYIRYSQEAMDYFRYSHVQCLLCPRKPDDLGSIVQDPQVSTMFAHHQKIVVVDHEVPKRVSKERMIVSFVGSMDVCDETFDAQNRSLIRMPDTVHQGDFHQLKGGPRNPWHETHACLEGPVAWDVLYNFEQIWRKHGTKDALLHLRRLPDIVPPSADMFPEHEETWNVQLFRSIDSDSSFNLCYTPWDVEGAKHASRVDEIIDRSIQDAYINAIRRAKDFIYIENQYFLGSSYCWRPEGIRHEDIGALHLIPKELALKVVSKIEEGERFAVYIVLPMWPVGIPESSFVQAILDWQRRTMEMMYTDIIQALQAKGMDANPKDYLTFFCLGSREVKSGENEPVEHPEADTDYTWDQKASRSMIHVHSKTMIVDDEYIIVGSANINQRSMDGARDTEIAIGAYQPYHLSTSQPARGQIHGFRMALWYEHLGMLDDVFLHPESLECVQKVNGIAEMNWDMYVCNDLEQDLSGHLLGYPVGLTNEGVMAELPGTEFFPDTRARVLGSKSDRLPPILTT